MRNLSICCHILGVDIVSTSSPVSRTLVDPTSFIPSWFSLASVHGLTWCQKSNQSRKIRTWAFNWFEKDEIKTWTNRLEMEHEKVPEGRRTLVGRRKLSIWYVQQLLFYSGWSVDSSRDELMNHLLFDTHLLLFINSFWSVTCYSASLPLICVICGTFISKFQPLISNFLKNELNMIQ